jgi:hypothetical protein
MYTYAYTEIYNFISKFIEEIIAIFDRLYMVYNIAHIQIITTINS